MSTDQHHGNAQNGNTGAGPSPSTTAAPQQRSATYRRCQWAADTPALQCALEEGHAGEHLHWHQFEARRNAEEAQRSVPRADFDQAMAALEDLSFSCFAGVGLQRPSTEAYNRAFEVLDRLRKKHNAGSALATQSAEAPPRSTGQSSALFAGVDPNVQEALRGSYYLRFMSAARAFKPIGEVAERQVEFRECAEGHGRLIATNWIDHGCEQCRFNELAAAALDLTAWTLSKGRCNDEALQRVTRCLDAVNKAQR